MRSRTWNELMPFLSLAVARGVIGSFSVAMCANGICTCTIGQEPPMKDVTLSAGSVNELWDIVQVEIQRRRYGVGVALEGLDADELDTLLHSLGWTFRRTEAWKVNPGHPSVVRTPGESLSAFLRRAITTARENK